LEGHLDCPLLLGVLAALSRRMSGWPAGQVFLHVSGHGYPDYDGGPGARVGMELQESSEPLGRIPRALAGGIHTLALPDRVRLLLLPDQ